LFLPQSYDIVIKKAAMLLIQNNIDAVMDAISDGKDSSTGKMLLIQNEQNR